MNSTSTDQPKNKPMLDRFFNFETLPILSKKDKETKKRKSIVLYRKEKETKALETLRQFGKLLLIKGDKDKKLKFFKKIKELSIKLVKE